MIMENYFIFAGIGLLAVCLVILAVEMRQHKWKSFLLTASVEDVVRLSLYNANMRCVLDDLNNQRAKDAVKADEKNGRLKSHPIEVLQDEGVYNADNMTELFLHSLQKTLIGYSQRERTFIREVGMMAYNRTVMQLCEKAKYTPVKK